MTTSDGITWFVAQQAAVNARMRMLHNAEWQAAALGKTRSSVNGITNGIMLATVDDQDVARLGWLAWLVIGGNGWLTGAVWAGNEYDHK